MEMLLKYILTDKGLFAALLGAIIGGIFAILGSLIAGFFTYLAVKLTFKYQEKNGMPKKLITVTRISSDIGVYIKELNRFRNGAVYSKDDLDYRRFREKLLVKAANVDKECYRIILNAFDGFDNKEYYRILIVRPENRIPADELLSLGKGYDAELSLLKANIDKRLKYYEHKI
jgi:hypothetical protein